MNKKIPNVVERELLSGNVRNIDPSDLFAPLVEQDVVIAAVSGGSDSMAMLYLLHAWKNKVSGSPSIIVATVDHQLRQSSAAEAELVADHCRQLGFDHVVLAWQAEKPISAVSENSREARHELLAKLAQQKGASTVVFAHTRDDQLETLMMRLAHGTAGNPGWRGLSGMARQATHTGFSGYRYKLFRPFLEVSRRSLRNFLKAQEILWCEDPGNQNSAYERIRVRQRLVNYSAHYPSAEAMAQFMRLATRIRRLVAAHAAALLLNHAQLKQVGLATLSVPGQTAKPELQLALKTLIAVIGGRSYFASDAAMETLLEKFEDGKFVRQTLCAVVIEKHSSQRQAGFSIWRENRNLETIELQPGQSINWDGRWSIEVNPNSTGSYTVGPLGENGVRELEIAADLRLPPLIRRCLISQVVLRFENSDLYIPSLVNSRDTDHQVYGNLTCRNTAPALDRFLPESEECLYCAVSDLRARRSTCESLQRFLEIHDRGAKKNKR